MEYDGDTESDPDDDDDEDVVDLQIESSDGTVLTLSVNVNDKPEDLALDVDAFVAKHREALSSEIVVQLKEAVLSIAAHPQSLAGGEQEHPAAVGAEAVAEPELETQQGEELGEGNSGAEVTKGGKSLADDGGNTSSA